MPWVNTVKSQVVFREGRRHLVQHNGNNRLGFEGTGEHFFFLLVLKEWGISREIVHLSLVGFCGSGRVGFELPGHGVGRQSHVLA